MTDFVFQQNVTEGSQLLWGATGVKNLIKRFGDLLKTHTEVSLFSAFTIESRGKNWTLARISTKISGLGSIEDAEISRLEKGLGQSDINLGDLRDGPMAFAIGDAHYHLASISAEASLGYPCLFVWKDVESFRGQGEALISFFVRQVQNESRWYQKLDRTQSLLYTDDLTGIYNSRYLEVVVDNELRRAERFQSQFCLLFIDLDGFKPINDNHGHMSGSSVLQQVANVIQQTVREIDVPIRYGGDEFVVVLLGTTCSQGLIAAERIRQRIAETPFKLEDGTTTHVTGSFGVAAYPEHGQDRDTLLKKADETMYTSKRGGKNRVSVVSDDTSTVT
jgi:diguanylate cyclase (GGDEF)-like protein